MLHLLKVDLLRASFYELNTMRHRDWAESLGARTSGRWRHGYHRQRMTPSLQQFHFASVDAT
jgi:hypothetical protein